jgi:hypothetical protein
VTAIKQKQEEALVQLVAKLKNALPDPLDAVVLYGSAVNHEFAEGFSDINVLVTLKSADAATMKAAAPVIDWWVQQGHPVPVVMTTNELRQSADVFAIEFMDMKQRHRVLHGEDPLAALDVPREMHRVQVERELRTAIVKLRQAYLVAKGDEAMGRLLGSSVSSFATLFRHALIVFGQEAPLEKRAAVEAIGHYLNTDVVAVLQVLDIREKHAPAIDRGAVFADYLAAVTRVTDEVDRRLG